MLTDFDILFSKYGIKPNAIAHLGSSDDALESPIYARHCTGPTIFCEALQKVNARMANKIARYKNQMAICALLSDVDREKVPFFVADNRGMSSSMLPFGTHQIQHPTTKFIATLELETIRFDTLMEQQRILLPSPVFLNVDCQGAELKVLRGMGAYLTQVAWAYIEVNRGPTYVGCPMVEEIDAFLAAHGFKRVETFWFGGDNSKYSWGDCVYVRAIETIIQNSIDTFDYKSAVREAADRMQSPFKFPTV